jgi:hypothetical protein
MNNTRKKTNIKIIPIVGKDQHYDRTNTKKRTIMNTKKGEGGCQFIKSGTKEKNNTKGSSRTLRRGATPRRGP